MISRRGFIAALAAFALPKSVFGFVPTPSGTQVIFYDVEMGEVKQWLFGQIVARERENAVTDAFECAAFPSWRWKCSHMKERAVLLGLRSVERKEKEKIEAVKAQFIQKFGYPPKEIKVARTDLQQITVDDFLRSGLVIHREMAIIAN